MSIDRIIEGANGTIDGIFRNTFGKRTQENDVQRLTEDILSSSDSSPIAYKGELEHAGHVGPHEHSHRWVLEGAPLVNIVRHHLPREETRRPFDRRFGFKSAYEIFTQRFKFEEKKAIREDMQKGWTLITSRNVWASCGTGRKWQIREFGTDHVLINKLPNPFGYDLVFTLAENLAEKLQRVVIVECLRGIGKHQVLEEHVNLVKGNLFGEQIGNNWFIEPKSWDSPADFLESIGVDCSSEETLMEGLGRDEFSN